MAQDVAPTTPLQDVGTSAAEAPNAQLLNRQLSAVIEALGDSSDAAVDLITQIAAAIASDIIGGTTGVTANRLLRAKGTGGFALQNSPILCDDSGNLSGIASLTMNTAGAFRTGTSDTNTALLQAYDVNGAAYTTFGTLTAGNDPTFDLAAGVTKGGIGIATLNTNTWLQQQGFGTATLTDAATIAWNLQTQQVAKVTLTDNRTLDAPTNMVDGFTYILRVIQDGTGGRTLAYNAVYLWPGGTAPVLSTDPAAIDILTFVSDGTNMYGVAQLDFS